MALLWLMTVLWERPMAAISGQHLQQRQRKRRGLASAGLGSGQQIPASEDFGNGPRLDWRGNGIAFIGNGTKQAVGEAEGGE